VEDIEAAEMPHGEGDETFDRVRVLGVEGEADCLRPDVGGDGMRPIRRDVGNDNPRALGGQPARCGRAYPTGATRDDRNLVGKSHALLSMSLASGADFKGRQLLSQSRSQTRRTSAGQRD
jgi:hypothetical protein